MKKFSSFRLSRTASLFAVSAAALAAGFLSPPPTRGSTVISIWDDTTGNWSDPTQWSSESVPNNGGGTSYDATVHLGSVSVDGNFTVTNFTLTGGAVAGNGTLTVSGALNFTGGAFGDGSGAGTTSGAVAITIGGNGGAISRNYTLANTGAGSWTGTGNLTNSGTLNNSGTFTIQNNQIISSFGVFNNAGTLTKTVATGTTTIQSVFNNTGGSVNVLSGTLSLQNGGTATGNATFDAASGGVLSFDFGTFTIAGGTSFVGAGVTQVTAGTININGPVTATNFTLTGGAVAGNGTLTVSGALNFTGGAFGDGSGAGTTSGAVAITIGGNGGAISRNYTLANTGAGSWTGSGNLTNSGTLNNSGTFTIQNNQIISSFGVFNNTGTLTKTVATGTTTIQSVFNNTGGSVNVLSGTLSLQNGGTATGNATFDAASGGVLSFDFGTFTIAGGTNFVGAGVTQVTAGTININGPVTATNFTLTGGAVAGNGTLTVNGALNFTGGAFGDGSGTGTTSGAVAINIGGNGGAISRNYTLANTGAGSWTGTGNLTNSGTLNNSGTFTIQNNQIISSFGVFNNTGTLTKTVATGTTTIQSVFNNTGGTVNVQSGTISLAGTVTNFNGATNTLTNGTWMATGPGATLSIDAGGGNLAINTLAGAADVTVGNATATITGLAVTAIGSGSALRAVGGAAIGSGGALTSAGTVEVGSGSTLDVQNAGSPATFTQTGGHLLLAGGTVNASAFVIVGGQIEGSGSLSGGQVAASGSALLSPGESQSIGEITTSSNFNQTAGTGLFELGRIGGVPVADLFAAQGSVAFSNVTFTLALVPGSAPLQLGDTFTIFQSDSDNASGGLLTLTADTFIQDPSLAGVQLTPFETSTTFGYEVTALTPEPDSGIMMAIGLLALLSARPRPRQRN